MSGSRPRKGLHKEQANNTTGHYIPDDLPWGSQPPLQSRKHQNKNNWKLGRCWSSSHILNQVFWRNDKTTYNTLNWVIHSTSDFVSMPKSSTFMSRSLLVLENILNCIKLKILGLNGKLMIMTRKLVSTKTIKLSFNEVLRLLSPSRLFSALSNSIEYIWAIRLSTSTWEIWSH